MPSRKRSKKHTAKKTPKPAPTTTHKDRAVWFYQRAVFPLRDAPPTELERAWHVLAKLGKNPEHQWEEAGPFNIAGRVTSLVVHPDEPNKLFAGAAAGGVWRSDDGGVTWEPSWPRFASQNIGALAMHPFDRASLIAATGEANLSADTYPGTGIYVSGDAGTTWQSFFETPTGEPIPEEFRALIPRRIGTLAFDPFRELIGALGGVSLDERMQAGLYLVDPSMGLAPCSFFPMRSYNCHSVVFHPGIRGMLFAALELRGSQNGIWRSEDSGKNWVHLKRGLPPGEEFGRTSLAIAPSDPDTIYALAANRARGLLGIFRSTNHGNTWRQILDGKRLPDESFMSYNNTIVVHPEKPDFVIWGGVNLYRTKDGGARWAQITTRVRTIRHNYVHEDQHALVMPRGDLVYSGNDGGVAVSHDGGDKWAERSRGMVTTMFYDVDVAPGNSRILGGGAQDNGTLIGGVSENDGDFVQALTGDGGWIVFDEADEEHVFGSFQNLHVFRHRRGQPWANPSWTDVSPRQISDEERGQRAIAVLAIEPGHRKGIKKLWAGSDRLWRTIDDGKHWKPVSDSFDGSVISAIEIASSNPRIMFVGTTKGGIFRSKDGGKTWSQALAGVDIPPRLITRIETHPRTARTVVVTVASTGLPGASLRPTTKVQQAAEPLFRKTETRFQKAYSNVFQSDDMGESWKDIDGGSLPNVVFYALAFETRQPYRLFAAGDAGVFVKEDDGWTPINGNLPNVVVSDLVYHHKDQILVAATYGRGIWRLHTDRLTAGIP